MVGHHAGDRPDALRGTGEHLLRPGLPHPAGTLAPEPARVGPAARRRRSRDAGQASAPGDGRPRGSRAWPTAAPSLPRQARCRRPPARGHRGYLDPLRPAGGPPPQPLQVHRAGDPPLGGPTSPGVTAPGGARPPGRPRGDGTCAGALTAATDSCPAPPGMRPRPGALLSSDDCGSSVKRAAKLHPLWQAQQSGEGWLVDRRCTRSRCCEQSTGLVLAVFDVLQLERAVESAPVRP